MATGGGAFLDKNTRGLIMSRAISVWLRASLDTLAMRLERSRTPRPLLDKEADMRGALSRLIDERYPIYEESHIVVDTGDGPQEPVVDSVYNSLQSFINEENIRKNEQS